LLELTALSHEGLPNRAFELKAVRGIDFRIGLGVA
jgi:hypothetical protein